MAVAVEKIDDIFWNAAQLPAGEPREQYLNSACAADRELRQCVEKLLLAHHKGAQFLEKPFCIDATEGVDARPSTDPASESVGTLIGPYKLLEQIGEGGMGLVYMAEQQRPVRRLVALKLVKPGMDSKQVIARFEAERQALAMMDHPNIAKVLDAGAIGEPEASASGSGYPPAYAGGSPGRPYFVMELVRGIPITEFCDQKRLTVRQRLELFIQVCQAVQHAHQKGIIHRDLKPTNVLVTMHDTQPVPKVIDFGIAKALADQSLATSTSHQHSVHTGFAQLIGTPLYMSPEQAEMNALGVDTRSDVYSLGVLLYELLTGTTPFDKERLQSASFDELRRIIREEEPETVSTRLARTRRVGTDVGQQPAPAPSPQPRVPRLTELDWIVAKTLEKDRNRRYESASALAADLQRYITDEPVHACPPSAIYRLRKLASRYRGALTAAALIATALLAGTAISTWQAVRATHAQRQATANEARAIEQERIAREAAAAEARAAQAEAAQRQLAESNERKAREEAARADAEAQRAKTEATIAQAINDFLNHDLLKQADPQFQPDRNIPLRTVLDRAAARIGDRFQEQPLVEAALRATLGDAYYSLGDFAAAEPHFERAYSLRFSAFGEQHAATIKSLADLAALRERQGRCLEAEPLLRRTADACRRFYGEIHPESVAALAELAEWLHTHGHYSEAALSLEHLRDIRPDMAAGRDIGDVERMLASVYMQQGRFTLAKPLLVEAVEVAVRMLGNDHPTTLARKCLLGAVYRDLSNYAQAEQLLLEALTAQTRILGEEHPSTLETQYHLAWLYRLQGRLTEAEALTRKTLKSRQKQLGPYHPTTIQSINALSVTLSQQRRYNDAAAHLKDVIEHAESNFGSSNPATFQLYANLADVYAHQRRETDAEALFLKAIAGLRRISGNAHPRLLGALNSLAMRYTANGRFAEAEPLLLEVLATRRRELDEEHPDVANGMNNLAFLYQAQGRFAEAEPLFVEATQIKRRVLGPDDPLTLRSLNNVAMIYQFQGRHGEVIPLLEEALERARRVLGENHQSTLLYLSNLASACEKQQDLTRSESLYREALSRRRAQFGSTDVQTIASLADLGGNLLRQQRQDEAEPLLREALKTAQEVEPEAWITFSRQSLLGEIVTAQARTRKSSDPAAAQEMFQEAESLLTAGWAGLKDRAATIPAQSKYRITDALARLIELYTAWDKPAKAAPWQAELEARAGERK